VDVEVVEVPDDGGDIVPVACDENIYVTFDYDNSQDESVVEETIILDGSYLGEDFRLNDRGAGAYRVVLKSANSADGTITFTNAVVSSGPTSIS